MKESDRDLVQSWELVLTTQTKRKSENTVLLTTEEKTAVTAAAAAAAEAAEYVVFTAQWATKTTETNNNKNNHKDNDKGDWEKKRWLQKWKQIEINYCSNNSETKSIFHRFNFEMI